MSSSTTNRIPTQAHEHVAARLRWWLPTSLLLLSAACEPLSCQGAVATQDQINVVDEPVIAPKCKGNEVIFNGDVDVQKQAELNALSACTQVNGSIRIHDSADIVDLAALSKLERVGVGYISIFKNAALENATLPALTTLENGFSAIDNPLLTTVAAPELPQLGGDLVLRNSPLLRTVNFKKVERIANSLFVIDGVPSIVTFGNVVFADLPALTTLEGGFDALEIIEGAVDIHSTGLLNFNGLQALREIQNTGGAATVRTKIRADKLNPGLSIGIDFDNDFNIVKSGNPDLVDFTGLNDLDSIGGDIFVGYNDALTSFTGLDDLTAVGGNFFVVGNKALRDFSGFNGDNDGDGNGDGLSSIAGSLFVGLFFDRLNQPLGGGNDALQNFDGLNDLTSIGGDFVVAFNTQLEDFTGLDILATLSGDMVLLGVEPNSLEGTKVLTTIGGSLSFGEVFGNDGQPLNPDETDVARQFRDIDGNLLDPGVTFDPNGGDNGFEALTTVNGNLVFAFSAFDDYTLSNPATADLSTVNGSLIVYGNGNPDSLNGLQTLATLGGFVVNFAVDAFGDLQPFENQGLSDFSAVQVANLGAGGLHIGFNGDLDDNAFATFNDFVIVAGDVTLARVVAQNNLGPSSLADLNIGTISGDLTVCGIKNDDSAPINATLGNLEALNLDGTSVVAGNVFVGFCTELVSTSMSLTTVGGSLEFTDLPNVETIDGLGSLGSVGELLVHDLSALASVSLPALGTVNGNLELVRDPNLENLDLNVGTVGGALLVVDLAKLASLDGLNGLNTVGGDLDLIDLPDLVSTNGLDSVDSVGGTLRLRRLDNVNNAAQAGDQQDLSFAQLTTVGSLEIQSMGGLEDLAGLQTLTTATSSILILNNPRLKTLFGLQGLTSVGRKVAINDNPELELAFFDDDNLDREEDINNNNGVNNEPEDPDNVFEAGIVNLTTLGSPVDDNGVTIGGSTGVLEMKNNPNLDQADFQQEIVEDLLNNYEGLVFFCGNNGSDDSTDEDLRLTSLTVCPVAGG
jgi:hypothetical protein